jgi:hypothetical protein
MAGNVEKLRKAHEAFSSHNFDEAMHLVAPTTTVVDHGRNQTVLETSVPLVATP